MFFEEVALADSEATCYLSVKPNAYIDLFYNISTWLSSMRLDINPYGEEGFTIKDGELTALKSFFTEEQISMVSDCVNNMELEYGVLVYHFMSEQVIPRVQIPSGLPRHQSTSNRLYPTGINKTEEMNEMKFNMLESKLRELALEGGASSMQYFQILQDLEESLKRDKPPKDDMQRLVLALEPISEINDLSQEAKERLDEVVVRCNFGKVTQESLLRELNGLSAHEILSMEIPALMVVKKTGWDEFIWHLDGYAINPFQYFRQVPVNCTSATCYFTLRPDAYFMNLNKATGVLEDRGSSVPRSGRESYKIGPNGELEEIENTFSLQEIQEIKNIIDNVELEDGKFLSRDSQGGYTSGFRVRRMYIPTHFIVVNHIREKLK